MRSRAGTRLGVAVVGACSAFAASVALASAHPDAGYYAYCPPLANVSVTIPGDGRCVSEHAVSADVQYATTSNGDGVYHCAVLKQYSNGSGGNTSPLACGSSYQVGWTGLGNVYTGWATTINESTSPHAFWSEYHPR